MAIVVEASSNIAFGKTTSESDTVTIDADADAAIFVWGGFNGSASNNAPTATLNSASPDESFSYDKSSSTDANDCYIAVWYNPPSGSQTLAYTLSGALTYGPSASLIQLSGVDTNGWRDADADSNASAGGGDAVSVTLTTETDDFVLKHDFSDLPGAGNPSLSSGWTDTAGLQSNDTFQARTSYITATGSTQVCDSEDESFAGIVAASFFEASSGAITGSGTPALEAQTSDGDAYRTSMTITDVSGDETWNDGDSGIPITGTNFT